MCSGEPGALVAHARFCSVCGVDSPLLPCVALSRRGALRVLALGPTVPRSGTCEPAVLFGRPPASTQLRARQGKPGQLESVCGTSGPQQRPKSCGWGDGPP